MGHLLTDTWLQNRVVLKEVPLQDARAREFRDPLQLPPETDSQASGSTPHVGLSDRSVDKQPSPFSVFNKPPQSTIPSLHNSTVQYYCSWIDSLRDKLPTLLACQPSEEFWLHREASLAQALEARAAKKVRSCEQDNEP